MTLAELGRLKVAEARSRVTARLERLFLTAWDKDRAASLIDAADVTPAYSGAAIITAPCGDSVGLAIDGADPVFLAAPEAWQLAQRIARCAELTEEEVHPTEH